MQLPMQVFPIILDVIKQTLPLRREFPCCLSGFEFVLYVPQTLVVSHEPRQ